MDPVHDIEDPPDGAGWWPTLFLVDHGWADARGSTWRSVTNYPTLQARRQLDMLGPSRSRVVLVDGPEAQDARG